MSKTVRAERRSREDWTAEVSRWRRSGLGAAQYAAERGLKKSTLLWWSCQLGPILSEPTKRKDPNAATPVTFLPVHVREEPMPRGRANSTGRIEVVLCNGRRVRIRGEVDCEQLALVLEAADGECAC